MTLIPTVVLPGLDGTGLLLSEFASFGPNRHETTVMTLPVDCGTDFGHLVSLVLGELPEHPVLLIAESFSGPIAIRIAAAEPSRIAGLVLVATFVGSPIWRIMTFLPLATLFRLPVPKWAVRRYLVGNDAPNDLVELVCTAIRTVNPKVLASRVRMIGRLDVREECRQCTCPILYLRAAADSLVPVRCGLDIAELNPQVDIVTVDAPHFVLQRKPEEVWDHIQTFADSMLGI